MLGGRGGGRAHGEKRARAFFFGVISPRGSQRVRAAPGINAAPIRAGPLGSTAVTRTCSRSLFC